MASKLKAKPPEDVKPRRPQILVYGDSGAGKSWFITAFPSVYFIDTEGGASRPQYVKRLKEGGGAYLGVDDGSCDFDTIIGEIKTLMVEKHQYRTLGIDSISKVFHALVGKRSAELGDADQFGASKKPAIAKMRQLIALISKLDMNLVIGAHEIALWGDDGKGGRKQTGFGPDVWEKLRYELDLTLRIEKHSRGLRTATVDKSRILEFPEFDRFKIQENGVDMAYPAFAERYGKAVIEAEAVPVVLATPEQVAEIERLLTIVRVEPETIEKWKEKARAEEWGDLTTAQADGVLKLLQTKLNGGK